MTHSTISLGVGLGGGKAATSSGRLPSGGYSNEKSVLFDGTDDRATFTPGRIDSSSEFSMSLWVKVVSLPGSLAFILATKEGSTITLLSNGNITFETRTYSSFSFGFKTVITGANTGQWYHFAMVKTNSGTTSTFEYYVDGSSIGTDARTLSTTFAFGSSAGAATTAAVGSYHNTSYYGNVIVDELAIFPSALSSSDVTAIYNSGAPDDLDSHSPRNWYRMGDGTEAGSGTTVYDMGASSGTTTDLTLVNATYSTDVPS